MKQSVTVGAQLLWSGRYGCNNVRYGCTIVMSYIEINKAVSQWLLTFNLCVSATWPLTCAFHIPCTHTPEIIDMHRGMCDKEIYLPAFNPYCPVLFAHIRQKTTPYPITCWQWFGFVLAMCILAESWFKEKRKCHKEIEKNVHWHDNTLNRISEHPAMLFPTARLMV